MEAHEYDEYTLEVEKEAIAPDRMVAIDAAFDDMAAWLQRLDPIQATLDRFERAGSYAKIIPDASSEEIVFINHDASRFSRTPEQICRLFGIR